MSSLLLQHGADPNQCDCFGRTALYMAASHGYLEVVRLLLSRGADIEQSNRDGDTPLSMAAAYGHHTVVAELMKRDANPHVARHLDGASPLMRASAGDHVAAVQTLLELGVRAPVKPPVLAFRPALRPMPPFLQFCERAVLSALAALLIGAFGGAIIFVGARMPSSGQPGPRALCQRFHRDDVAVRELEAQPYQGDAAASVVRWDLRDVVQV